MKDVIWLNIVAFIFGECFKEGDWEFSWEK
jgi:hypothetical protein